MSRWCSLPWSPTPQPCVQSTSLAEMSPRRTMSHTSLDFPYFSEVYPHPQFFRHPSSSSNCVMTLGSLHSFSLRTVFRNDSSSPHSSSRCIPSLERIPLRVDQVPLVDTPSSSSLSSNRVYSLTSLFLYIISYSPRSKEWIVPFLHVYTFPLCLCLT